MDTVTAIIAFTIILVLIYIIYNLLNRKAYTGAILNANAPKVVDVKGNSSNCSYSIWIYVNNWTNEPKTIFSRDTFSVGLDTYKNMLIINGPTGTKDYTKYSGNYLPSAETIVPSKYYSVSPQECEKKCSETSGCEAFNYYDSYTSSEIGGYNFQVPNTDKPGCILINTSGRKIQPNELFFSSSIDAHIQTRSTILSPSNAVIPLQEWVFIVINMNSNYMEVYINGKLVNTLLTNNNPNTSDTVTLTPNGGFDGWTSKFAFQNSELTTKQIWNKYKQGYGNDFSLSNYKIKVQIVKEDSVN